ncbi:MAG: AtpZ/AtpI family protein [Erysipelotrichaceae bacterium]|nr:AtpZ/AtpI family protein [Erysipelotrichaceae bacterium]
MSKTTLKFVSRIVLGLVIAIFLGRYLDDEFNTTPLIMLVMIIYVIVGSLYILIKEEK